MGMKTEDTVISKELLNRFENLRKTHKDFAAMRKEGKEQLARCCEDDRFERYYKWRWEVEVGEKV